jgi:hypothetical protein
VKQRKPTKTWERTRLPNLIRHKSGSYYARAFAGGKEVWKSLKTSHFSVAEAKLAEFLKEHRERRSNANGEVSAKMTFGEAATAHLRNLDDNLSIKPRTRDYWREVLAALVKSWPGLNETEVRKITQGGCKAWATAYAKKASPTRYNNTVAILRHVLNVAVESSVIYSNPAALVKRTAVRGKEIYLPTIEKFNAMIAVLARCFNKCGASVPANRWMGKYSVLANVKRVLIELRKRSAQIVSRITTCGIYSQRAASNRAWTFRPCRAGSATKTVARC